MIENRKSVEVWWDSMDESQKGIVRLIVQMIGDADENQALEITRDQGQMTAKVVDRPAKVSAG
jgi:hypothetical protein